MKGKKFRAVAAFLAVVLVVGLSPVFGESKVYAYPYGFGGRVVWTKGSDCLVKLTGEDVYNHVKEVEIYRNGECKHKGNVSFTVTPNGLVLRNAELESLGLILDGSDNKANNGINVYFYNTGNMARDFHVIEKKAPAPAPGATQPTPKNVQSPSSAAAPAKQEKPAVKQEKQEKKEKQEEVKAEETESIPEMQLAPMAPKLQYTMPEAVIETQGSPIVLIIVISLLAICLITAAGLAIFFHKRRKE